MKSYLVSKLRSFLTGVFALLLGAFVALTTLPWFPIAAQSNMKSIEKRQLLRPEVVPIEEIRTREKLIQFGEAFQEGSDWLKEVRFRLKNKSGREIVYLELILSFPETSVTGNVMSYSVRLGNRPGGPIQTRAPLLVRPDDDLTVILDEDTYANLKKFIELRQAISTLNKVTAYPGFIVFSDGVAWSGGEYQRQDPANPNRYINIGPVPPNN